MLVLTSKTPSPQTTMHTNARTHTPHCTIIKSTFTNSWSPSVIVWHIWSWAASLFWQLSCRTVLRITCTEVPEFAEIHGALWMKHCSMLGDLCHVLSAFIFLFNSVGARRVVPELNDFHHPANDLGNILSLPCPIHIPEELSKAVMLCPPVAL